VAARAARRPVRRRLCRGGPGWVRKRRRRRQGRGGKARRRLRLRLRLRRRRSTGRVHAAALLHALLPRRRRALPGRLCRARGLRRALGCALRVRAPPGGRGGGWRPAQGRGRVFRRLRGGGGAARGAAVPPLSLGQSRAGAARAARARGRGVCRARARHGGRGRAGGGRARARRVRPRARELLRVRSPRARCVGQEQCWVRALRCALFVFASRRRSLSPALFPSHAHRRALPRARRLPPSLASSRPHLRRPTSTTHPPLQAPPTSLRRSAPGSRPSLPARSMRSSGRPWRRTGTGSSLL
jgi:hypothetical protein